MRGFRGVFPFWPHGSEPQASGWPARLRCARKWGLHLNHEQRESYEWERRLPGIAPRPRRLQVLTMTGYSSLPSGFVGFVLFVVDLVLGFRLAPNRVVVASTRVRRRAGIALPAGHVVQARKSDSALNRQSASGSRFRACFPPVPPVLLVYL